MKIVQSFVILLFSTLTITQTLAQDHSVAREWNEVMLEAIRGDFARPTVHARNLFHTSIAMYDIWAAYDDEAETFFLGKTVRNYTCPFDGVPVPDDVEAAREEAISYAAYRILSWRFLSSPGAVASQARFDSLMLSMGYDPTFGDIDYTSGNPAELGNYVASQIINFGFLDGSNEQIAYNNLYYRPLNAPFLPINPGNAFMIDPNRWQPLSFDVFVDQSGNEILDADGNPLPSRTPPPFLSPEWGNVTPFALQADDLTTYNRFGRNYQVYHDPGDPALLQNDGSGTSDEYKWGFALVSKWSSHLDPADGVMWDISPASIGNIDTLPTTLEGLRDFYDEVEGGDPSRGHALNPHTGQPYEPQIIPRADYARALAEFWADGPDSETPPGHWFTILNYVNDHPLFEKRYRGVSDVLGELEWDVKAYFTLGGAVHDAAISAWGIKGWYDYVRPISAIRFMAGRGQSSDPNLPSYHPQGIPLHDGFVELVEMGDTLAGANNEHLGKIKVYAWRGPDYISDPETTYAGVGWILAENWWPYQRPTFVTPPFAGYISGHSTFSRAAAEVLTMLTGDAFFPGGMGEFEVKKNDFLVFEEGPSVDFTLQWATYRDASDQTSLSRIWGGIHPPVDDIPGRLIGIEIGTDAFLLAEEYFYEDRDNDGYFSYEDCDDTNPMMNPGLSEICDGLDNDCTGFADDGLPKITYYLDADNDGYGDPNISIDTCLTVPPAGYVTNNVDCNSDEGAINPDAVEICDGIDNDCNGFIDDTLPVTTYYYDADGDGYGDAAVTLDTCLTVPPANYVINSLDCDDFAGNINPSIPEICDGIDNDCNGLVDDGLPVYGYYRDADDDGFGDVNIRMDTCQAFPPDGFVIDNTDCNDAASTTYPGASEIADNDIDEDCSGLDLYKETKIFPNPTTASIEIHYDYTEAIDVEVYDMVGKLLKKQSLTPINNFFNLDLGQLPRGVYVLKLSDLKGERLLSQKILKI